MVKKTLVYTDYNGDPATIEAHFDIDEVELAELEATYPGGFSNAMRDFMNNPSEGGAYNLFATIVKKGYCRINSDGSVDKSEASFNKFRSTKAYNCLFCEIIQNKGAAEEFFSQMIQTPVLDKIAADMKNKNANTGNNT